MTLNRRRLLVVLTACLLLSGCASGAAGAGEKTVRPIDTLLHLPGIAGPLRVDRQFVDGLRDGGLRGEVEVIDWTENDPGLNALFARKRNDKQATRLANRIEQARRASPKGRIVLTAHSGGTAIVVWALEQLPDGIQVDDVLLLAPALSPDYDLSKALRPVRGKAHAFTSPNDVLVLGLGTQLFRTMDGKKVDAAGRVGFAKPEGADDVQYAKLVSMPYDPAWMKYGNIGDHIGVMDRRFVATVLAPLVVRPEDLVRQPEPVEPPATAPITPDKSSLK
jgi:pimeloyl-ACP methyl ester carboxylesterase